MKKSIKIILFLLFLCPFEIWPQYSSSINEKSPEQIASRQTEKLREEIKLSDEQYKQIYQINLKYAVDRQQINSNRMNALKNIRKKNDEIKKFLTKDQAKKLEEMKISGRSGDSDSSERSKVETRNVSERRNMNAQKRSNTDSFNNRVNRERSSFESKKTERSVPASSREGTQVRSSGPQKPQGGRR